jgi:choline dehydrogenase
VFEGKKAVGVRYVDERSRTIHEVKARKEVIVCGGTVNSPRLLQLSGVGSGSLLKSLGVEVVTICRRSAKTSATIAPSASWRVRRIRRPSTKSPAARADRPGAALAHRETQRDRREPFALLLLLEVRSEHQRRRSPAGVLAGELQGGFVGMLDDYPGMSCGVWQHRPESTGYVRAKSTDIFVDPAIQPNYLSHEVDQRALVGGIELARRLLRTPQLSRFVDRETFPGDGVRTDDEILHWARQYGGTVWHLIGTCRMGPRHRQVERGERRAQGPWPGEPARDRRLDHAEHAVGQHLSRPPW